MGMKRNKTDLCIFYKWIPDKSITFITSWIDDLLNISSREAIKSIKLKIKSLFDCSDEGEMKEYVGCRIDYSLKKRSRKITQPIIIQSFINEFDLPN